ncbi:18429_t:CDS:2, partial [Rhizophagus irregularis]
MGKSNKKKSSQQSIPVQEFVDSFTNSFASLLGNIIFDYLQCGDVESEFYKTATAKLVPKGDIVTERSILDNVRVTKQFTRTLNQAIISGARCKARQTLDSLSSRYQNALPSLVQSAVEAQLKKKEKKVGKQKAPVSDDADANLVIDESMNIDDNAKSVALISFVGPMNEVNWCLSHIPGP